MAQGAASGFSAGAAGASSVGRQISAGLASGISAGRSGVISAAAAVARAAIQAAKNALAIRSPSRVFKNEVGLMAMKGFGAGIIEGEKEQARIIRNASAYLTKEAQGSIVPFGSSTDNRKTYNQQSTVNLTVSNMTVNDKQDIQSLAIEIAALTKRRQVGKGLR